MKILVVGAGPAGLLFAHQIKTLNPSWEIKIIEKNKPEDVIGWGVVLPGRAPHHPANALSYLTDHDQLSPQYLEEFNLVHQGQNNTMSTGVTLCAVERHALIQSLREHCTQIDIPIEYSSPLVSETDLHQDQYDLVVLSNGISHKINYFKQALKPKLEYGDNKYIWYGTSKTFDYLSLIFKTCSTGVFVAHAYKFSNDMSTFVVECSEQTYHSSGLDQMSDNEAAAFVGNVFNQELEGYPLLGQEGLKWRNFMTLSHQTAYDQNLVLIGDALQSGHFSIGHGTTMAVVAAQMLVKALSAQDTVAAALVSYNSKVIPLVHLFADHANISRLWFEGIDNLIHFQTGDLMESFDTRRNALPPLPPALGQALGDALKR